MQGDILTFFFGNPLISIGMQIQSKLLSKHCLLIICTGIFAKEDVVADNSSWLITTGFTHPD